MTKTKTAMNAGVLYKKQTKL